MRYTLDANEPFSPGEQENWVRLWMSSSARRRGARVCCRAHDGALLLGPLKFRWTTCVPLGHGGVRGWLHHYGFGGVVDVPRGVRVAG